MIFSQKKQHSYWEWRKIIKQVHVKLYLLSSTEVKGNSRSRDHSLSNAYLFCLHLKAITPHKGLFYLEKISYISTILLTTHNSFNWDILTTFSGRKFGLIYINGKNPIKFKGQTFSSAFAKKQTFILNIIFIYNKKDLIWQSIAMPIHVDFPNILARIMTVG